MFVVVIWYIFGGGCQPWYFENLTYLLACFFIAFLMQLRRPFESFPLYHNLTTWGHFYTDWQIIEIFIVGIFSQLFMQIIIALQTICRIPSFFKLMVLIIRQRQWGGGVGGGSEEGEWNIMYRAQHFGLKSCTFCLTSIIN